MHLQHQLLPNPLGDAAALIAARGFGPRTSPGSLLDYLLSGHVNFTGGGLVGYGDTLPPASRRGWFLHTPTGRTYLMCSTGSAWQPFAGFGAATLYVDGASGSDSQAKGTGTGSSAYATVLYAVDQTPPLLTGSLYCSIAAGTYREQVTLRGKFLAGNLTLTLAGTLTLQSGFPDTATAGANPAANGAAGYGTITDGTAAYTVNAYRNMLVYIDSGTGAGQLRVIHANTATAITIVGRWDTVPDNTSVFSVYDFGTRITGSDAGADTTPVRASAISVEGGQRGIELTNLKLNYASSYNLLVNTGSACNATWCLFGNATYYGVSVDGGAFMQTLANCVLLNNTHGLLVGAYSAINAFYQNRVASTVTDGYGLHLKGKIALGYGCYHSHSGTNCVQLYAVEGGGGAFDAYTEFNGAAGTGNNLSVTTGGQVAFSGALGATTTIVSQNSGGWGAYAESGGVIKNASLITYAANTSGNRTPATMLAGGTD